MESDPERLISGYGFRIDRRRRFMSVALKFARSAVAQSPCQFRQRSAALPLHLDENPAEAGF
jgi:hypothetical protein